MPIEPDTKDWTWVLDESCPECGFDAAAVDRDRMGPAVRTNAALWPGLLLASTARSRPSDERWSALEYGCHVRDVFVLFDERLRLMLETDAPHFANWDQDVTAIEERYDEQDPEVVSEQLLRAAEALATRWDSVAHDQWERTGHRSDGATFTVDSFARYFLHDPVHHLVDVANGNTALAAASGEA